MFQMFLLLLLAIADSHPPADFEPVLKLLNDIHLEEYVDLFQREEISVEVLPSVTEEQFRQMGVRTLGQRIRIVNAARQLVQDGGRGEVAQGAGQVHAGAQVEDGQGQVQAVTQRAGQGQVGDEVEGGQVEGPAGTQGDIAGEDAGQGARGPEEPERGSQ